MADRPDLEKEEVMSTNMVTSKRYSVLELRDMTLKARQVKLEPLNEIIPMVARRGSGSVTFLWDDDFRIKEIVPTLPRCEPVTKFLQPVITKADLGVFIKEYKDLQITYDGNKSFTIYWLV